MWLLLDHIQNKRFSPYFSTDENFQQIFAQCGGRGIKKPQNSVNVVYGSPIKRQKLEGLCKNFDKKFVESNKKHPIENEETIRISGLLSFSAGLQI